MESKFIELHQSGGRKLLNVDKLVAVVDTSDNLYESAVLLLGSTIPRGFDESYDEIKQLIHDSGILIHRADPRLNTERELTFAELREMIGEPVWNSNLLRWELVKEAGDLYITTCSTGQYDSYYDEGDLIKTPLYRMKRFNE